jgi:hypothetical protein
MDENNEKEITKYLVQLDDGAADQIHTYAELMISSVNSMRNMMVKHSGNLNPFILTKVLFLQRTNTIKVLSGMSW